MRKVVGLLCLLYVPSLGACAAKPSDAFPDPDLPARAESPEGAPYPTGHVGTHARRGSTPGNTIPNFAFQGYVGSDRAAGLKPVSLADYFDPAAAHHKVLHIAVAAAWCATCATEADTLVALAPALGDEGAVFLLAMVEGREPGKGPTLGDFDAWIDKRHTTFNAVLDSNARRFGTLQATGVPWNALVDTRTMEILDTSLGAPDDVAKYVRLGIAFVNAHPR